MIKTLLLAVSSALLACGAFAQADTSFYYFGKGYKPTTKDSAIVVLKMFRNAGGWYGKEYYAGSNVLKSEGTYMANDPKTPDGTFINFKEDGTKDFMANWANGKLLTAAWAYKNGNKRALIVYGANGETKQTGWDEAGNEIKDYVIEREARFKGGLNGWRKYLEKNLNANVAADAGAPAGTYPVKVQFVVSKEGFVSNVKAVEVPARCKPCATEAVNVIASGPPWEPAVQLNQPVMYQAIQYITFVVEEEKKKRKG